MPKKEIVLPIRAEGAAETERKIGDVRSSIKKLVAAYVSYKAVAKVGKFFADTVERYATQKQAVDQLSMAIGENAQAHADWAARIQTMTTLTDQAILGHLRYASAMGHSNDKIQEVVKGGIGLARVIGIDVTSAMKYWSRALSGQVGVIGRFMPTLNKLTSDQEKLAFVTQKVALGWEMERRAAGLREWDQVRKVWTDIKEIIGSELIDSVNSAASGLKEFLRTDEVKEFASEIGKVASTLFKIGAQTVGGAFENWRFGGAEGAKQAREQRDLRRQIQEQQERLKKLEARKAEGPAPTTLDTEINVTKELIKHLQQRLDKSAELHDNLKDIPETLRQVSDGIGDWWERNKNNFFTIGTAAANVGSGIAKLLGYVIQAGEFWGKASVEGFGTNSMKILDDMLMEASDAIRAWIRKLFYIPDKNAPRKIDESVFPASPELQESLRKTSRGRFGKIDDVQNMTRRVEEQQMRTAAKLNSIADTIVDNSINLANSIAAIDARLSELEATA